MGFLLVRFPSAIAGTNDKLLYFIRGSYACFGDLGYWGVRIRISVSMYSARGVRVG